MYITDCEPLRKLLMCSMVHAFFFVKLAGGEGVFSLGEVDSEDPPLCISPPPGERLE